jgi:hypothetical protein
MATHSANRLAGRGLPNRAPLLCEWYVMCQNEATTTRRMALGDIPICARCDALTADREPKP